MPWRESSLMDQRLQFIAEYILEVFSMTELCVRYGISRKTGYKWVTRYVAEGPTGLLERSRRPHHSPRATPPEMVEALVAARRRHPDWGAKKLLPILAAQHPDWPWPAVSTANLILARHGLSASRPRRRRHTAAPKPRTQSSAANDLWTADFKGEFRTGDRVYCYPLTIVDDYSRYLLACRALLKPTTADTRSSFARLFRTVGMPRVIRTDNGLPFAGKGLSRLSRLSAWWTRLGITHELIQPAHPEQNGRHERLHRTLKQHTVRPPAACRSAQQRRFNHFRQEYNEQRPHEALGQVPPGSFYTPSPRAWPEALPSVHYPGHFELRRVGTNGCMVWHTRPVFVSSVLSGESIGLEELAPGIWDVYYCTRRLGVFIEAETRIEEPRILVPQS